MNSKKNSNPENDIFGEEDWSGDNEGYFAFIDSIETLENDQIIMQFDCVNFDQVINLKKRALSFEEMEALQAAIIICDFSQPVYKAFIEMVGSELREGVWLVLRFSAQQNQFSAEVLPEYVEGIPSSQNRYLSDQCKIVDNEDLKKLKDIFYLKQGEEEFINMTRLVKLKHLLGEDTNYDRLNLDVVVMKVGQGSMNAIMDETGTPIAYFDVGGGAYRNAKTFLPPNPRRLCLTKDTLIILSHWDSDHWWTFNRLLRNNPQLIPKTTWIVPFQEFGAIQRKFYGLLKQYGHNILCWSDRVACPVFSFGQILKCNGQPNDNNNSGLALIAMVGDEKILLPGDASYEFITGQNEEKFSGMVATHHGGKCTDNIIHFPKPQTDGGKIVYSYGFRNTYNHTSAISVNNHTLSGWSKVKVTPKGSVSFLANVANQMPNNGQCDLNIEQVF